MADDDKYSAMLLKNVLERSYTVELASDGLEAMQKLRSGKYSLLITDIQMPHMSGWDVLAAMQEDEALRDLPVIVITADNQPESEIRALNMGASDVIVKPFVAVTLLSRVQNTIARREVRLKEEKNRLYEMKLQQQEKLLRLADRDELTGLYSRKAFVREAGRRVRESPAGSYVVSCLNVDGFKVINDRYGHGEGDKLLKYIGRDVLKKIYGDESIVCRDVADVFMALLPNNPESLHSADRDVPIAAMSYSPSMRFTVSIGRYVVTEPEIDVNLMIDRAMIAQRTIKGNFQKHVAWYNESMREKMLREKELTDQMRASLECGQFEVWFQPQYDYPSMAISGAEALVRWRHPELGVIMPGEFIPLFERNGFISDLDSYVWEQTCSCMGRWKKENGGSLPFSVSVNISRVDADSPCLSEELSSLVDEYGLAPKDLRLEITESAYMDDPDKLIDVVKTLRRRGFLVEMDDFGSGYSSLNTLKHLPVDVLKLDMRFLSPGNDQMGKQILGAVIQLANSIDRQVIAEGVETKEHAEMLLELGCSCMQGYFFSKPLPQERFEKLFRYGE